MNVKRYKSITQGVVAQWAEHSAEDRGVSDSNSDFPKRGEKK